LSLDWQQLKTNLATTRAKYSFRRKQDIAVFRFSSKLKLKRRPSYYFRRAGGRTSNLLHRKALALPVGAIFPTVNFARTRGVQIFFNSRRREGLSHKPRRFTAMLPKNSALPRKLRLIGTNPRTNIFKRSMRCS